MRFVIEIQRVPFAAAEVKFSPARKPSWARFAQLVVRIFQKGLLSYRERVQVTLGRPR